LNAGDNDPCARRPWSRPDSWRDRDATQGSGQASPGPSADLAQSEPAVRLSVIIPYGPGETEGTILIAQLRALPNGTEIVLAGTNDSVLSVPAWSDGGSVAVRVCQGPVGRARQLNAGARVARGRWLWFVHADSRLQPNTLPGLAAFLGRDRDALGYFDLRYRDDGPALARFNAACANLRSRWFGMPFGDQGLVVPAAWFNRVGGYDETVACGEDHLLVWRARATGLRLHPIGASLASSARKYAQLGWCRATARNLRLTVRQAWPQWRRLRRMRLKPFA